MTRTPAATPAKPGHRIYALPVASVYPLYIQKVEKKGRTRDELDDSVNEEKRIAVRQELLNSQCVENCFHNNQGHKNSTKHTRRLFVFFVPFCGPIQAASWPRRR